LAKAVAIRDHSYPPGDIRTGKHRSSVAVLPNELGL
jgi:hypothetical protein